MKNHTKVYFNYFEYGEQDFVPSEYSGAGAGGIHHLTGRGKGKDEIWNLIGITSEEHDKVHFPKPGEDGKAFNEELKKCHAEVLLSKGDKENADKILQTMRKGTD